MSCGLFVNGKCITNSITYLNNFYPNPPPDLNSINNKLKNGTNDKIYYEIYFFVKLLLKANEYLAENKYLCSVTLPWEVTSGNNIVDSELLVVLYQRCIVNRDSEIHFTKLFEIVYYLLDNQLKSVNKCCIPTYKNFNKYMGDEINKYKRIKYLGIK